MEAIFITSKELICDGCVQQGQKVGPGHPPVGIWMRSTRCYGQYDGGGVVHCKGLVNHRANAKKNQ